VEKIIFESFKIISASFSGALFAFLFLKYSEKIKDKKENKRVNYRALNKIQFICNINVSLLTTTKFMIEDILAVFNKARERYQDPFSASSLDLILIDRDLLLDLNHAAFLNDYFSYFRDVEKHNSDIANFNKFHESLKMARIKDDITSGNYLENINRLEENLRIFNLFVEDMLIGTKLMMGKCRVLLKNAKLREDSMKSYSYGCVFDEKLKAELELLDNEMKAITESSKQKITEILSKTN